MKICWGSDAEAAAEYPKDTRIALEGRLQSREYTKRLDGTEAILMAYEVSARHIEKRI